VHETSLSMQYLIEVTVQIQENEQSYKHVCGLGVLNLINSKSRFILQKVKDWATRIPLKVEMNCGG